MDRTEKYENGKRRNWKRVILAAALVLSVLGVGTVYGATSGTTRKAG